MNQHLDARGLQGLLSGTSANNGRFHLTAANDHLIAAPLANEASKDQNMSEGAVSFGGSGGGASGGMESRVSSLETHMEYVRRDLDELRVGQATIIDRLNHIPTKADLDTWRWQWLATGLAIVALTVGGITGGLALIARFAS